MVEQLQKLVGTYHPNRKVNEDHTVSAATGNTALFSKEELQEALARSASRKEGAAHVP